jgi:RNA polymerase subunit RPABC4/transcription elongation factor Spt4
MPIEFCPFFIVSLHGCAKIVLFQEESYEVPHNKVDPKHAFWSAKRLNKLIFNGRCGMCGRNFGSLLIPALAGMMVAERLSPSQAPQQTAAQMTCPQCKSPVSPGFSWCPQCGQALKIQAKPKACTYCGRTMTAEMQYCPSCGGPAGK